MLKIILEKIENFPTIMTVQQELDIISEISQISDNNLLSEIETLKSILDYLYESHTGGAIFEVNESNQVIFHAFAERIYFLAGKTSKKSDSEMLESIASALDTIFPQN